MKNEQVIRMTLLKVEVKSWWKQLFCQHNFNVFIRSLFAAEQKRTQKAALYQCCNCGRPHLSATKRINQIRVNSNCSPTTIKIN